LLMPMNSVSDGDIEAAELRNGCSVLSTRDTAAAGPPQLSWHCREFNPCASQLEQARSSARASSASPVKHEPRALSAHSRETILSSCPTVLALPGWQSFVVLEVSTRPLSPDPP